MLIGLVAESPRGVGALVCGKTSCARSYEFDILDVKPPPIPKILLSYRRRSESKNVGRIFADEKA